MPARTFSATFALLLSLTTKPAEETCLMLTKATLAVILFVFCLAPVAVTSGQSRAPITGEWRIEFKKDSDEVQLTMSRGKTQSWGHGIKISEVQGLSSN